jgi:hypothetical protein
MKGRRQKGKGWGMGDEKREKDKKSFLRSPLSISRSSIGGWGMKGRRQKGKGWGMGDEKREKDKKSFLRSPRSIFRS